MAALIVERAATALPVTLDEMKTFLRVSGSDDDSLIDVLLRSAVDACENFTARSFCHKGYRQSLDSFPYYTDTVMSQMAYPPSYYAAPRFSTTLWNYSQMIKLFAPPLVSVDRISYLAAADNQWHDMTPIPALWYPGKTYALNATAMDNNGNVQKATTAGTSKSDPPVWNKTLNGTTPEGSGSTLVWTNQGPAVLTGNTGANSSANDQFGTFLTDGDSEPARLFPGPPGNNWPAVLYVPGAVQIHFTAGFAADGSLVGDGPGLMPGCIKTAIMQCVANWYENREAAMLGQWSELPNHCKMLLWTKRVLDYQPTRG